MARLARMEHLGRAGPAPGCRVHAEGRMLDVLMLALAFASFALLARYLLLCERG